MWESILSISFCLSYRPQLTFSTRVCFLMASLFLRFSFGFPSVHCSKSVSALFRKFKGSLSIIHPLPSEVRLFITQRNQDNFQPTSSSSPLINWDIWRKEGKMEKLFRWKMASTDLKYAVDSGPQWHISSDCLSENDKMSKYRNRPVIFFCDI